MAATFLSVRIEANLWWDKIEKNSQENDIDNQKIDRKCLEKSTGPSINYQERGNEVNEP